MELEYGRPVEEVFVDITPEPLAAASLGQVLKLLSLRTHTEADQLFMYEKYVQVASDASRRGMKRPKSHRNKKMQGTTGGGGGGTACYVTPDVNHACIGGRERRKASIKYGWAKNRTEKKSVQCFYTDSGELGSARLRVLAPSIYGGGLGLRAARYRVEVVTG